MSTPSRPDESSAPDAVPILGPKEILEAALERVPDLPPSMIASLRSAASSDQHRVDALKMALKEQSNA
jgi:hypothetical protein